MMEWDGLRPSDQPPTDLGFQLAEADSGKGPPPPTNDTSMGPGGTLGGSGLHSRSR